MTRIPGRKNLLLYVFFGVVLISANLFVYLLYKPSSSAQLLLKRPPTPNSFSSTIWLHMIDQKGPQETYKEFKTLTATRPQAYQHLAAHVIGDVFYKRFGLSGIKYCDDSFIYGCYHGLFFDAIREHGIGVVKQLDTECKKAFPDPIEGRLCSHGLGHGIAYQYGEKRVPEALHLCASFPQSGAYDGCSTGIFMEYFGQTDESNSGILLRPLDLKNPYAICPDITGVYRQSCYSLLAEWWNSVFPKETKNHMTSSLCESIPGTQDKFSCYLGYYYRYLLLTHYNTALAETYCDKLDTSGISACKNIASWWKNQAQILKGNTVLR